MCAIEKRDDDELHSSSSCSSFFSFSIYVYPSNKMMIQLSRYEEREKKTEREEKMRVSFQAFFVSLFIE